MKSRRKRTCSIPFDFKQYFYTHTLVWLQRRRRSIVQTVVKVTVTLSSIHAITQIEFSSWTQSNGHLSVEMLVVSSVMQVVKWRHAHTNTHPHVDFRFSLEPINQLRFFFIFFGRFFGVGDFFLFVVVVCVRSITVIFWEVFIRTLEMFLFFDTIFCLTFFGYVCVSDAQSPPLDDI